MRAWIYLVVLFTCSACGRKPYQELSVRSVGPVPPRSVLSQIIVIDPGHGGEDYGTKSILKPCVYEKTLTLRTAKLVYNFLLKKGYEVRLTRNKDIFIPLLERVRLANNCKAKLFVSIHYNAASNKQASGIEVFYYKDVRDKIRTFRSERLAKNILTKMIIATKAPSRGVKRGNFAVIRETTMPAVLVEAGFLTNRAEAIRLKDPNYLKFLAFSIALGIEEYLK